MYERLKALRILSADMQTTVAAVSALLMSPWAGYLRQPGGVTRAAPVFSPRIRHIAICGAFRRVGIFVQRIHQKLVIRSILNETMMFWGTMAGLFSTSLKVSFILHDGWIRCLVGLCSTILSRARWRVCKNKVRSIDIMESNLDPNWYINLRLFRKLHHFDDKLVDVFQVSRSGHLIRTFGYHSIFVNRFVSLQDQSDNAAAGWVKGPVQIKAARWNIVIWPGFFMSLIFQFPIYLEPGVYLIYRLAWEAKVPHI